LEIVMAKAYSETVKSRMIQRMVGPRAITAHALAAEVGIHQATLSRWRLEGATVHSVKDSRKRTEGATKRESVAHQQKRPEDWTPMQKLQAVMEASQLSESELGEWLRRKGLHEAQLSEWRSTVAKAAEEALDGSTRKRGSSEGKRVKELERELRRKDKALAETAALLVLSKKADALWGDEDVSMGSMCDGESSR
jgi:hypothetical protein